jgi:hypothetical protein
MRNALFGRTHKITILRDDSILLRAQCQVMSTIAHLFVELLSIIVELRECQTGNVSQKSFMLFPSHCYFNVRQGPLS